MGRHTADRGRAGWQWTTPAGESRWRDFPANPRPRVRRVASAEHPAGLHHQVGDLWVHVPWTQVQEVDNPGKPV